MRSVPQGLTLKTEANYSIPELIKITIPTYHDAFKEGVWKEDLSYEEIAKRLSKSFATNFHGLWLIDIDNKLVATSWYQFMNLKVLRKEKGAILTRFAKKICTEKYIHFIVWHTETITHPNYKSQGLGSLLKKYIFEDLETIAKRYEPILLLTRMEDDNKAIIKINEELGLKRTGIRMPCTTAPTDPNKYHEFWYKVIN